jgi:hypothetical protein
MRVKPAVAEPQGLTPLEPVEGHGFGSGQTLARVDRAAAASAVPTRQSGEIQEYRTGAVREGG